jgi:hypothetical protein
MSLIHDVDAEFHDAAAFTLHKCWSIGLSFHVFGQAWSRSISLVDPFVIGKWTNSVESDAFSRCFCVT